MEVTKSESWKKNSKAYKTLFVDITVCDYVVLVKFELLTVETDCSK